MSTYQQIRAIQQYRFGGYMGRADRAGKPRRRHVGVRDLLGTLGRALARLGFRDHDGRDRPASPAY